jgi:hypothetical protein
MQNSRRNLVSIDDAGPADAFQQNPFGDASDGFFVALHRPDYLIN